MYYGVAAAADLHKMKDLALIVHFNINVIYDLMVEEKKVKFFME